MSEPTTPERKLAKCLRAALDEFDREGGREIPNCKCQLCGFVRACRRIAELDEPESGPDAA